MIPPAIGALLAMYTIANGTYKIATAIDQFKENGNGEQFALNIAAALPGGIPENVMGKIRDWILGLDPKELVEFSKKLNDLMQPMENSVSDAFTAAQKFRFVSDPLTLDLDGDGLETTGIDPNTPILFDHNADGIKTGTGWVKADDGMLVLDRNGNGSIDSGLELFGDSTVKSNGQLALDGFDALADLDSNADGQISSTDAQFASLRVWRDLNQDGISQGGELFTLDSLGIASISTAQTANSQTLANENQIADLGTYTRTDGSTGTSGDINLAADTFHREFTSTLDTTTVAALPDMQGSGVLRDLRQAATQSATLQTLLTQYSAATTREAQLALLDPLLDAWADTGGMAESLDDRVDDRAVNGMADDGAIKAANDDVWRVAA